LVAHKTVKPVNFRYLGVAAKAVSIVGDFNEWQPEATPMKRHYDGSWQTQVPLSHGHHQYAFIVDGQLIQDSRAFGAARNAAGQKVSLIAVS
jgi:1,4-alpha-glucan branching enzyme